MDTFRMRCFVSVAKNGSISRAAREMFITQPAMTAQMNALEKELDAHLLERGKTTTLTQTGECVLGCFVDVLARLEEMGVRIKEIEQQAYGKVRIGFHGPYEWARVDLMLQAFHEQYPHVEVNVTVDTWNGLCAKVQEGELSAAFVEMREVEDRRDLVSRHLFDEKLAVVVPREHRLADRAQVTVRDIMGEPLHEPDYRISPKFLADFDRRINNAGLDIKSVGQGNHWEATVALVAAGLGVSIMPRSFKHGVADSGDVVFVGLEGTGIVVSMGLAWRRCADDPTLMRFVNFCSSWDWGAHTPALDKETG